MKILPTPVSKTTQAVEKGLISKRRGSAEAGASVA
jgi:hypothetical protein